MRNGEILAIGTPEELIIHSTHPYVTEFTRHCDRSRVLRARSLSVPVPPGFVAGPTIDGNALVADVAGQVLESQGDVGVVIDGKIGGILRRAQVIAALTGRPAASEAA